MFGIDQRVLACDCWIWCVLPEQVIIRAPRALPSPLHTSPPTLSTISSFPLSDTARLVYMYSHSTNGWVCCRHQPPAPFPPVRVALIDFWAACCTGSAGRRVYGAGGPRAEIPPLPAPSFNIDGDWCQWCPLQGGLAQRDRLAYV